MSATAQRRGLALPRLARTERGRALGGVASGIGSELGVDPTLVRLVFALLAFAGGAGIAAYVGSWLWLPLEGAPEPSRRRRALGLGALVVAGALLLNGLGLAGSLVWPLALVAVGVALYQGRIEGPPILGAALVVAGVIAFLDRNLGVGGGRQPLVAPGAVLIGLLLVVGPWLWRLARERDAERSSGSAARSAPRWPRASTTPCSRRSR